MPKTDTLKKLVNLRTEVVSEIAEMKDSSKSISKIYAQINYIEYRNKKFYITGDLLTDKLMEFDNEYFSEFGYQEFEENKRLLRPITWEFRAVISLEEVIEPFDDLSRELYSIVKRKNDFFSKENIKTIIVDDDSLEELSKYYYYNLFEVNYNKKQKYNTTIGFSASPYKTYKTYITFKKPINNINANISPLPNIMTLSHSDLSNSLKKFKPSMLKEFNVGQGNFSELVSDQSLIVFDVGFTRFQSHYDFSAAVNELQNLKAECFLVSHIDTDHILGSIYLDDSQFQKDKLWIVQDLVNIKEMTLSAKRLIWYLFNSAKLRVIKDSSPNNIFDINDNLNIYRGTANHITVKDNSEYINGSGIMLLAKGNCKKALLTGDCLYEYWGQNVPDKCDYFVVPHHGCKVNMIKIKGENPDESEAIIPVGRNTYGHPDNHHIKELLNRSFVSVQLTKYINQKTYNLN